MIRPGSTSPVSGSGAATIEAISWTPISGDLSRGLDRCQLPMMGRVQSSTRSGICGRCRSSATITSLRESPLVEGLIYVGTDDGLVQVTKTAEPTGARSIGFPASRRWLFVNDIKADLHDSDTVYVALDQSQGGRLRTLSAQEHRSGRPGRRSPASLPARHLVWRIVQDHVNPNLMFAGTEFGVFFTVDAGAKWIKLSGNAPNISFRDLLIQKRGERSRRCDLWPQFLDTR